MSNPEKRDDRSMSDILASIRKIMAQEPALAVPPGPARPSLNGVSGPTLDLPREPELKLPPEQKPSQSGGPAVTRTPPPAPEAVSLDELLAETPRAAPPPPATPASGPAPQPAGAPEWLFPRQGTPEVVNKDKPIVAAPPVPAQAREPIITPPAAPPVGVPPPASAAKAEKPEPPKPATEPPAAEIAIGPPAPHLGDLGSVVPGKLDGAKPAPVVEAVPEPAEKTERPALGPPLAGPLLGEPARTPPPSETLPEVPGADALRRLIAGVIPPSAHPSLTPAAKAPEPPTAPAPARAEDVPKPVSPKPPETKAETKAAPAAPAAPVPNAPLPTVPVAKKPDVPAPAPSPSPSLAPASLPKAAAPVPVPGPSEPVKPAAPTRAATPDVQAPAAKPAASGGAKTMDETVVELLRPLLREWLNTNMPRLIEPALKAELEALRSAAKDKKD